jgi:hypothetical protein
MGKSSLSVSFVRVIKILYEMAPTIIIWPTGDRRMAIKRKFRKMAGVDNVIGVVDGTFVPIKAPLQNPESYVTRNSYFYIKCVKRVFFVHEKVFYAETKVEAV